MNLSLNNNNVILIVLAIGVLYLLFNKNKEHMTTDEIKKVEVESTTTKNAITEEQKQDIKEGRLVLVNMGEVVVPPLKIVDMEAEVVPKEVNLLEQLAAAHERIELEKQSFARKKASKFDNLLNQIKEAKKARNYIAFYELNQQLNNLRKEIDSIEKQFPFDREQLLKNLRVGNAKSNLLLVNPFKRLCLDDGGLLKGSKAHLVKCNIDNKNQQFTYNQELKQIKNINKNLCFGDENINLKNGGQGSKIELVSCNPNDINQQFVYNTQYKQFINPNKRLNDMPLCLDDGGGREGSKFHLWSCDSNNQNQIYLPHYF